MKEKAIVFDIDGVILDTSFLFDEIFRLGLKGDAMWDYFYENCNSEKVQFIKGFEELYITLHSLKVDESIKFILLTSRNEKGREGTEKKLRPICGSFDALYMRPEGDYRDSQVLKKETLQQLQKVYDIILFIDDDLKNCEAAKELGIYSLRKV